MKKIRSVIKLDKPYVNIKNKMSWDILFPSGKVVTSKMPITKELKEGFDEVGISVRDHSVERIVEDNIAEIGDMTAKIIAEDELEYMRDSIIDAGKDYRNCYKPVLEERGYVVSHLPCIEIEIIENPCKPPKTKGRNFDFYTHK